MKVFAETGDLKQAADTTGCHVSTIKRLLTRDAEGFALVKKEIARNALVLSAMAQERAEATASQLSPMQAYIASKIASQQAQELCGEGVPMVQVNIGQLVADTIRTLQVLREAESKASAAAPAEANQLT